MHHLSKIPFVRILLPFVLGIFTSLYYAGTGFPFVLLIGIFLLGTMLLFIKVTGSAVNRSVLLVLDLFLFFFALDITQNAQSIDPCTHYSNYSQADTVFWVGQVDDIPVNKPRSLKLNLKVVKIKTDTGYANCQGNVIAYIQRNELSKNIKPGNVILIKSVFQEVGGAQNPYAFNFKNYLAIHSVYHTSYVDSNSFSLLSNQAKGSLWQMGLGIKYKIIKRLGEVELSENARTICSALITGFDDDIDKEVLENFSHSGTLHILSVSGLHVGLIYLVLNYFLSFIDRNKKYKLLQLIFISICLWFFALITGFSAPVLRSVIMFNLLGFGNLYFRNKAANQINILAVSAFILLLYNPLLVQDIGFLLSYFALFGILYFFPKIHALYSPKNKITESVWKSVAVSFSATLTTLPITLLIFHQFPIWFAFANLIIVPLSFALLLLSFIALFKLTFISNIVNLLTAFMISFISIFGTECWSFIDSIDFNFTDAVFLVLVLIFTTSLFLMRSYKYALGLVIVIVSWQLYALGNSYESKTKNELVVYQVPRSSCISIKNKLNTFLSQIDTDHYTMSVKPNLISYNNANITTAPFNFCKNTRSRVLMLNEKNKVPAYFTYSVTHLLISNNAIPKQDFIDKLRVKMIVADGSNSYWAVRKLEKLCEDRRIQFYSTRDKGAFVLPL